ncbi:hypothetical protein HCN44_010418 [Aphidius gifuensis]|uniref:Uncharacterized protein n=1 Tax=Aphidius gifuensis TaxID=684658 RepID=A0A835CVW1_APHGI|nr:hypothetical protein HCN44_010418 [Aphidius gifuensis]
MDNPNALQIEKLEELTKASVNNKSRVIETIHSIELPSSTSFTITSVDKFNLHNDDKKMIADSPQKSSAATATTTRVYYT